MAWGTPGCVRAIHVVAQHLFHEAHNSNQATPEHAGVIQPETPTNAPRPRGQV